MSTDDLPIATVNENNTANDTTMPVLTSAPTFATNNLYQSDGPPPMSSPPMQIITSRIDCIVMERQAARTAQFAQAERMVKKSRIDLAHGHPGDNVAVPMPLVNRVHGDTRNILGVILKETTYTQFMLNLVFLNLSKKSLVRNSAKQQYTHTHT